MVEVQAYIGFDEPLESITLDNLYTGIQPYGPGLYCSTSLQYAQQQGEYIHTVKLTYDSKVNVVDIQKKGRAKVINDLFNAIPNKDEIISKVGSVNKMIEMTDLNTEVDTFIAIYQNFFKKYNHIKEYFDVLINNKKYLTAFSSPDRVVFYICYNPEIIEKIKVEKN